MATTTNSAHGMLSPGNSGNNMKQIIIPKPVKVSPKPTTPNITATTPTRRNPVFSDHCENSPGGCQPSQPKPISTSSPTTPVQCSMARAEKQSSVNYTSQPSGTPERLANEELHKILFSRNITSTTTTPVQNAPSVTEMFPSPNYCSTPKQYPKPSVSPFSTLPIQESVPRSFSPPTIELEINESIFEENQEDDDDMFFNESTSSIPSTFGYDDEDFRMMRSGNERKKRNFVTQEDLSFLIELRTRPVEKYHLYEDFDFAEDDHRYTEGGVFVGAELGLLTFSPPSACNSILNF